MVRFMHAADLHLDQTFHHIASQNEELYKQLNHATEDSFERLIDIAINEKIDFLLISGDIFNGERASLQAQFRFNEGMKRLSDHDILVYMIYGNHDYIKDAKHRLALPDNVYTFGEEVETIRETLKTGEVVAISGFSYMSRWIDHSMVPEFPQRDANVDFHIGLYHGEQAKNDSQNRYAPFTISELREKGYDYWALGHIHLRQQLSANPPMLYPGNLQGSSFKEQGPKGALLVSIKKGEAPQYEFVETSDWQFISTINPLPKITSLETLRDAIERVLHEHVMYAKREGVNVISRLIFKSNNDQETLYWWNEYRDELREQLRWSLSNQNNNRTEKIYLADLAMQITSDTDWSPSRAFNESLKKAYAKYSEDDHLDTVLADLNNNDQWQKFLRPRIDNEAFKQRVLSRVRTLIVTEQANYNQEQRRG